MVDSCSGPPTDGFDHVSFSFSFFTDGVYPSVIFQIWYFPFFTHLFLKIIKIYLDHTIIKSKLHVFANEQPSRWRPRPPLSRGVLNLTFSFCAKVILNWSCVDGISRMNTVRWQNFTSLRQQLDNRTLPRGLGGVCSLFFASMLRLCAIKQGFPVWIRKQSVSPKVPGFIVSTGAFVCRFLLAKSDCVSGENWCKQRGKKKICMAAL